MGKKQLKLTENIKTVRLLSKELLSYDKLVIGVGSKNFVPPIDGIDMAGVYNLKFYEDLENINAYIRDKNKVTIIGGGIWALKQLGCLKKLAKK